MGSFQHPDLPKRFDELKKAVAWASEVDAVWRDQDDGGIVNKPNKAWVELRPKRFAEVGTDEVRHEDLETPLTEGTLENPRQDVLVSWREIFFEARFRSRSQKHKMSGWYAAMRFKTRMKSPYLCQEWLKPMFFSLVGVSDIFNMPEVKIVDDRREDIAVVEFSLNAVLCETDETNVGTWIDRCLVSSDIGGLDDSLDLDDEVMGWPDGTIVVDNDGTPVEGPPGALVLES